jgi:hypothetical protein
MKTIEVTYGNGNKETFQVDCIADYFDNPTDWGRSFDSLLAIVSVRVLALEEKSTFIENIDFRPTIN